MQGYNGSSTQQNDNPGRANVTLVQAETSDTNGACIGPAPADADASGQLEAYGNDQSSSGMFAHCVSFAFHLLLRQATRKQYNPSQLSPSVRLETCMQKLFR